MTDQHTARRAAARAATSPARFAREASYTARPVVKFALIAAHIWGWLALFTSLSLVLRGEWGVAGVQFVVAAALVVGLPIGYGIMRRRAYHRELAARADAALAELT